jgi:hypothetical protein
VQICEEGKAGGRDPGARSSGKNFRKNLLFLKKKNQKDFCEFAAATVPALVPTDLPAKVYGPRRLAAYFAAMLPR